MRVGEQAMLRFLFLLCFLMACVSAQAAEEKETPSPAAQQEITLNDVRDAGIMLNYIKRQAIGIYEEAARPNIDLTSNSSVHEPDSIPDPHLPAKVLPARQEWLVFYLGTMETVIRQLAQEVSEIDKGTEKLTVSKEMEVAVTPLWEQWSSRVKDLNHHLDELVPLFDEAEKHNAEIQKVAVSIFNDARLLEETRKSIFATIQGATKKNPDEKILISPPMLK
jgi:hypothetical protein